MRRFSKPFESRNSFAPGDERAAPGVARNHWDFRESERTGFGHQSQEENTALLGALTGMDADADIALANRTRRAIHRAAAEMKEARRQSRRSLGIAAVSVAALVLLLAPALWSGLDDMFSGEFALDMQDMVATLVFALFAAIAAVLFLLSGRAAGHEIRHLRR